LRHGAFVRCVLRPFDVVRSANRSFRHGARGDALGTRCLCVAAGIAHLIAPEALLAITPSRVPFAPQVILVTGLCEPAGALALVTKPLRWVGGHRARGLCALRLAGEFQACFRRDRPASHLQQLVVSWAAAGVSAGPDLVGALCGVRHRLAMAQETVSDSPR
jgi:hypothetical protein